MARSAAVAEARADAQGRRGGGLELLTVGERGLSSPRVYIQRDCRYTSDREESAQKVHVATKTEPNITKVDTQTESKPKVRRDEARKPCVPRLELHEAHHRVRLESVMAGSTPVAFLRLSFRFCGKIMYTTHSLMLCLHVPQT